MSGIVTDTPKPITMAEAVKIIEGRETADKARQEHAYAVEHADSLSPAEFAKHFLPKPPQDAAIQASALVDPATLSVEQFAATYLPKTPR